MRPAHLRSVSRLVPAVVLLVVALLAAPVLLQAQSAAAPSAGPASGRGVDTSAMDRSVAPGDDFFAFANGAWLARTQIPPDRVATGVFDLLEERASERNRTLLQEAAASTAAAGSLERKVGDYFAAYLDEAAIEAKGAAPLAPALARIAAIDSPSALARVLGEDLRADVDPLNATNFHTDRLFGLWVSPDLNDTSRNVAYLLQGGLDLPDREYYLSADPKMVDTRAAFRRHVEAMLKLAGIPDADARAERVVALETRIAGAHATRLQSLSVADGNNPWPRAEFPTRAPGLDWNAFFAGARLDTVATVIVWHAKATTGIAAIVGSEPLATWKDWLTFHAIDRNAGVLPRAFLDERFAFHGKTLSGAPALSERWKRAVAATNDALGEAVGQLYVKRYFPPETKAALQTMVANIIAAFGKRIDALDWMSATTRARAKEKVATLYVGVGYPEKWIDYGGLAVVRGDAFGNAERASRFEYERTLAKLNQPPDKAEWWMTPQTVNAVNLPLQNGLNFPAAILEPPFFDAAAPDAVNYGAIGAVIGHEISHSFDDQGALFDATGKLKNWWTPEDFAHFEQSGARLAAQFDAYTPLPGLHVNGKQTLSENIADLAGLAAAYDAWKTATAKRPAAVVDGLTPDQQFFLSFAQAWRTKMRDEFLRMIVITDGHAPGEFRALTVRNVDAWYDAFAVKPGQRLYLAPRDRVRVW